MSRRMSAGMQAYGIGRMLAGTKWDSEMFDISAHLDRSLHYGENVRNISQHLGISHRNRGLEAFHQQADERTRDRARRSNPLYQVGISNQAIDRRYQALPPGKRFSRTTGRRYYERRENRSDRGHLL